MTPPSGLVTRSSGPTTPRRVFVTGVAAISQHGSGSRGLAAALEPVARLATEPASTEALPLPGLPPETPLSNPKARNARKMMSRGAYLAAAALSDLMRDVGWSPEQRELAGYFLGVGASGGSLDDVTALLDASIVADADRSAAKPAAFSLPAFGTHGLAACNPLLAFQLMNNFTLAHGAIFEGLGGPNGALFSRGTGTTAALVEAFHAIASGDCDRAVAGGADSATHPVTRAELAREGFLDHGFAPSEAAALLALSTNPVRCGSDTPAAPEDNAIKAGGVTAAIEAGGVAIEIEGCAIASGRGRALVDAIDEAVRTATAVNAATTPVDAPNTAAPNTVAASPEAAAPELCVIAAWGTPALDVALAWAREHASSARIVHTGRLGSVLAASPAIGWAAAIDLLSSASSETGRVLVIDVGVDGDVGAVLFARTATEVGGVA